MMTSFSNLIHKQKIFIYSVLVIILHHFDACKTELTEAKKAQNLTT